MLRRLMRWLGLIEEETSREGALSAEAMDERASRLMQPMVGNTGVVLCRGSCCVEKCEELVRVLQGGRMAVVDLRELELSEGQGVLDFIGGAIYANRGVIMRLAPGVFLATPHLSLVEIWDGTAEVEDEDVERAFDDGS